MRDHADRPEVLAPAGDWEAMRAAVANGADAVYFGLGNFNARHRATNFTIEELPQVMQYLHAHNVRGYVTFNTLIFSDELEEAAGFACAIAQAGADAVIVQDLGLARLIHRLVPSLPIHGSTQMTLTEPRGIEFVRGLGVERVILARELSLEDIQRVRAGTAVPVEVFVHGALCVAYSGQCLTSEALGGRSANRGQCAQACRLPYDLIVDGRQRDLGDRAYLLSPQDLAAHGLIADLVKLRVGSFKIEGRLKSAHYVAATTQTYRAAVDAALRDEPLAISEQQRTDLTQSFSRGFTHGFLGGVNHQVLVPARFPKSRGIYVGKVVDKTPAGVVVELGRDAKGRMAELKAGDGVVFDEGHPEQDEQGGRVFSVRPLHAGPMTPHGRKPRPQGVRLEVAFPRGAVNLAAVAIGSMVWKTDDPAVRKRLEQSFARDRVVHRIPLRFEVQAAVGQPLRVSVSDEAGHNASAASDEPMQRAQKHPLTVELLREQLGRLGQTPFELADVRLEATEPVMVPKSVLNDLRRAAIEKLTAARSGERRVEIVESGLLGALRAEVPKSQGAVGASVGLNVLCRSLDQLRVVLGWRGGDGLLRIGMVYCDFEDVRRYKEAVALAHEVGMPIGLGTIRVVKPHEDGLLRHMADCAPDAVLVRNLAALGFYRQHAPAMPLIGDYPLNIANELTAGLFAEQGLVRMVPSYDLNWRQLTAMLGRIAPELFECVIHQHMPMFHMEHCVFCATLSNGKDHRDCGRPCEKHRVELRDRVGEAHPLLADVGCRNTVFNARAQSAAEYVPRMKKLGIRHYRIELLRETPDEARSLIDRYARVVAGLEDGKTACRQLRVLNQLGVTRGTLEYA